MGLKFEDPVLSIRTQRRVTWLFGLLAISLVIFMQAPQLRWTATHGLRLGTDSGKASVQICWSMLTLMADTAVVTAWCMWRPRQLWWALVIGVILLVLWWAMLPLGAIVSGLLHGL
ncbi:MAG: hypothetical protein ACF8R7_10130 [Phycisphaerales bacterium JB039]